MSSLEANLSYDEAAMIRIHRNLQPTAAVSKSFRHLGASCLLVPTKPAMQSNLTPAGCSDRKPATLGDNRMGRCDDVVEGWEGQVTD
jgi:hypothetical protein